MGCDIHSYVEVQDASGRWEQVRNLFLLDDFDREWQKKDFGDAPFDWRSYGVFGFLADVRNYSMVPTIVEPRAFRTTWGPSVRKEYEYWDLDGHSASWLLLSELLAYDYEQVFEDRRTSKSYPSPGGGTYINGAALAEEGEGQLTSLRDFLNTHFFRDIEIMQKLGDPDSVRVVFWFDN